MMSTEDLPLVEESLDPDDWQAVRELGHRMVDDMMAYTQKGVG